MLNRRHIRVKVMQSIYAMHQHQGENLDKEEKFLFQSIDNMFDLYLLMLSALIEIREKEESYLEVASKKHLATKEERNPSKKFVDNKVLKLLAESRSLNNAIDDRKITNWKRNDDIVLFLLEAIKESSYFEKYMQNAAKNDFVDDRDFIAALFTEVIAPNDKLYDYLEEHKLTWLDDLPAVNTLILKQLKQINEQDEDFTISKLYKDIDDKEYVKNLFRKTVLNEMELSKEYIDKTPNWDAERIAEIDTIILKMAICELLKFPSIPVKVTINEYLEIAKEYSTPKSSIFINGILDNLVKDFQKENRLNKAGRGLL
ncbi:MULTISPECIES: transcription antitermination factor NusB [unclassified Flavobacterium]|uniref:transcription antitermination factor NusB n=1 Tax=unclassified Flavobacterium TaxID=196869 RepID=UPI0020912F6B|nr:MULTISPECIES: transcription antitermination factor NusB [unclassified Flavobacterium]MCO6164329.1 transcription antitermination factor NusB [Flavobacterium sp. NRK F7]|tara:strand:- start:158 stop:1102 length:945 start_codon:yes stop_codon:yes gene_type:complete